ncbi:unnamed protein product [Cuscuta campestris]|uniref:Uncharacterized protein n=1 Tax=Cuscuta campestris TaxID=132261 RepID=A0A484KB43_9ASTE|nr:unnamed protein product [Cuscuta campestris]
MPWAGPTLTLGCPWVPQRTWAHGLGCPAEFQVSFFFATISSMDSDPLPLSSSPTLKDQLINSGQDQGPSCPPQPSPAATSSMGQHQGFADATDMVGRAIEVWRPIELEEDTEGDMDQYQLLCRLTLGDWKKKRKRVATSHDELHRPSSSHEVHSLLDHVVIDIEDQGEPTPTVELGTIVVNSPSRKRVHGADSSGCHIDQRPPSLPAMTIDMETEMGSMRFSVPHRSSAGLDEFLVETTVVLHSADQACLDASSDRDLSDMVLLKFGRVCALRVLPFHSLCLSYASKLSTFDAGLAWSVGARPSSDCPSVLPGRVASVSARVAELEAEKGDLVCRLEEAVETFKASPEYRATAMEQMDKLVASWTQTRPAEDWLVKKMEVSFWLGLFQAQKFVRRKLTLLPKGTSLLDFDLPPSCDNIRDFDPAPYKDE